jgi:hypothetical protein
LGASSWDFENQGNSFFSLSNLSITNRQDEKAFWKPETHPDRHSGRIRQLAEEIRNLLNL